MEKTFMLIPAITKDTRAWTARVTVTEEIPVMSCRGESKMKRYVLTDVEGNDVVATVFDKDVPLLESVIRLFGVYEISNAQVKEIPSEYRVMDRPVQWRLQRTTLIRPDTKTLPTLGFLNRGLVKFSTVVNDLELGRQADIMGVVIEASGQNVALTRDGVKDVQRFTFVDNEMKPVTVTLWGAMVSSVGTQLEVAAKRSLVVIARRLTVTYFKGVALSAKNCSSFTVDPPFDDAAQMKSWFDGIKERELANLLTDRTIDICKARFDSGVMRLHTIKELEDGVACGDYWLRGRLSIFNEEQKLFYIACSRCYTKIDISEDKLHYFCWVCNKETVSTIRLLVQACIVDGTGVMKVSCIDAVAERVLDVTPVEFARLIRSRKEYDLDGRRVSFGEKCCTMLVRRTYGKRFDEKRRMLLVDYTEERDTASQAFNVEIPAGVESSGDGVDLSSGMSMCLGNCDGQTSGALVGAAANVLGSDVGLSGGLQLDKVANATSPCGMPVHGNRAAAYGKRPKHDSVTATGNPGKKRHTTAVGGNGDQKVKSDDVPDGCVLAP